MAADQKQTYDVDCPHCKKPFTATLMTGPAARHHGFKCPHCKLFVPFGRATEPAAGSPR